MAVPTSHTAPELDLDDKYRPTYDEIHRLIRSAALRIKADFDPDIIVAIGGGGFFPARVLRTFLKKPSALDPTKMRNIPIQAIGLSLYEEVAGSVVGNIGKVIVRTQWLSASAISGRRGGGEGKDTGTATPKIEESKDAGGLLGKNVLIVDEVDDTRTTLQYAYSELLSDVRQALSLLSPSERSQLPPTRFGIFVVHDKQAEKRGVLPILPADLPVSQEKYDQDGVLDGVRYFPGETVPPVWVAYPWECEDIDEHNQLAELAKQRGKAVGTSSSA